MATLADELLADLEDLQNEEQDESVQNNVPLNVGVRKTVEEVCTLWNSTELTSIMSNIQRLQSNNASNNVHLLPMLEYCNLQMQIDGNIDEYDVIVNANGRVADIENEIISVTKVFQPL